MPGFYKYSIALTCFIVLTVASIFPLYFEDENTFKVLEFFSLKLETLYDHTVSGVTVQKKNCLWAVITYSSELKKFLFCI